MEGVYRERQAHEREERPITVQLALYNEQGGDRGREREPAIVWSGAIKNYLKGNTGDPSSRHAPFLSHPTPPSCKAVGAPGSFQVYFILHIHGLQKQAPHPQLAHKSSSG